MKKYITSILFLLILQQLSAFNLYDQLCAFNSNWKKYKDRLPLQEARVFNSDKEYVQAHLLNVLAILQSNPVSQLDAAQYRSRMHLLQLLDGYRLAGNFPVNYYHDKRTPVFIDPANTHCAVGYLLQQTGHEDVALRVAATDNYAWVKDIQDTGLLEWQRSSGLSLEELKLVQGAYDFYIPNAFTLPDKYKIPQKPARITAYFDNNVNGAPANTRYIWCYGEGTGNVLNGRWEQNYAAGIPWIVGYFDNGKRTGQWMEYYQGTSILCRTENWRDDKLNGIRKRFDRTGRLVEEILFKDGNAVTKTNYDLEQSLTWIRKPLDSTHVFTEVYTAGGGLIATGHEVVYNPGNLLWFQNIELTALNSFAITSREISTSHATGINDAMHPITLYETPPLVEYKKEGDWMYYKDCRMDHLSAKRQVSGSYRYFGKEIFQSIERFTSLEKGSMDCDSIRVIYANNILQDLYAYENAGYTHWQVRYHQQHLLAEMPQFARQRTQLQQPPVQSIGQYNQANQKTGTWKYYNRRGDLYKLENYILPQSEEQEAGELKSLIQPLPAQENETGIEKWYLHSRG
jgi:hypothetical protein